MRIGISPEPPPLPRRFPDNLPPLPEANFPEPPPLPVFVLAPPVEPPPLPVWETSEPKKPFGFFDLIRVCFSAVNWLFGLASLMVFLAVLAAIPVFQFLSLGYMLEAAARVAKSGRLRDGFIGIRLVGRLGGIVAASWLLVLPIRLTADFARTAEIINPDGQNAATWRFGVYLLAAVTAFHISMAVARGGKLRYFLWPFNFVNVLLRVIRGGAYAEARDATWDLVMSLRLPYYFWIGFRGFIGALMWLAIPVSLLALGHAKFGAAPLVGFLGGMMLALVLIYLPLLQLRIATEKRFSAVFEWCAVRRTFARAPWAISFAFVISLAFALPLYLLKIEVVPSEAEWLPALVFMVFIFPARLLMGWAVGRAGKRQRPRHWFFRITGKLPLLPAAGFYVLIVFFSQYTSWNGVLSLYEQHAFLLPVPFFGM
ncbi:hypothetical protein [Zavarzinella formosa]|uniref:hypothetical protein n=1 Tax=Zavarzinella formosa TaxID=360055 RepID=UPI000308324F|nr:hypothetical protein [Zavarzinella formosa]